MLDAFEILVIAFLGFVCSLYTALGARLEITKVPWIRLLLNSRYLGGKEKLLHHLSMIVLWVVLSILSMLLFALIIRSFEPTIKSLYQFVHYEGHSDARAGLMTLSILSTWLYLFFVRRTRQVVVDSKENIPSYYLDESSSTRDPLGPVESSIRRNDSKFYTVLRALYYLVPTLFAPIYSHFYQCTGTIIRGCALMLIDKFGIKTILEFFPFHLEVSQNPGLLQLKKAVDGCPVGSMEQVCIILIGKIRLVGFKATEDYIENYLEAEKRKN